MFGAATRRSGRGVVVFKLAEVAEELSLQLRQSWPPPKNVSKRIPGRRPTLQEEVMPQWSGGGGEGVGGV